VPLNETIGGISTSLDSIPPRLQEAKRGLDTLSLNLDTVTLNMDQIASSTEDISASTNASLQVVEDYQQLANNLREEVESMQTALPGQLRLVFLGAALLLIWLGISQIGLLVQGLDLIERARKALIPPGIE
jgi:hypothetical protein